MRRLLPTARSYLISYGRTAALGFSAVMAMAFAPAHEPTTATPDPVAASVVGLDLDVIATGPTLDLDALANEPAPMATLTAASDDASTAVPYLAAASVAADAPIAPGMRRISFMRPIKDFAINSVYGMRRLGRGRARPHEGVDIACPSGTPVLAAAEGRVLRSGFNNGGYGRFIEVQHPNGMTTFYAHLSRIDVSQGETITAGEQIGAVGSTGRSTGPHLHFEVRRNSQQVNPTQVMGASYEVAVTGDSI